MRYQDPRARADRGRGTVPPEPAAVRGELPPADPTPATAVRDVLPLWMQMPAEWRAAVPDLSINLMAYSQEPSERLVYIKGLRYTEGERVEGKLTIEKITREGVILSYQGRRCLLTPLTGRRSRPFAPCRSAAPSTSMPRPRPTTAAGSSSCGAIHVG